MFLFQVARHREHLLNYIIFLRITPFLPNWFINITSPVINVPLMPFFLGTFIGMCYSCSSFKCYFNQLLYYGNMWMNNCSTNWSPVKPSVDHVSSLHRAMLWKSASVFVYCLREFICISSVCFRSCATFLCCHTSWNNLVQTDFIRWCRFVYIHDCSCFACCIVTSTCLIQTTATREIWINLGIWCRKLLPLSSTHLFWICSWVWYMFASNEVCQLGTRLAQNIKGNLWTDIARNWS